MELLICLCLKDWQKLKIKTRKHENCNLSFRAREQVFVLLKVENCRYKYGINTTLGGIPMVTRSGDLDPSILLPI